MSRWSLVARLRRAFARISTPSGVLLVATLLLLGGLPRAASGQNGKGQKKPPVGDTIKTQFCQPDDPSCFPVPNVAPHGANVTVSPGTNSYAFTVQNVSHSGILYFSNTTCSGAASGCTVSPSSASLATNATATVTVTYTGASAGGSGTVDLFAQDGTGTYTDDGWINVTVNAPPSYTVAVTPDGTQNVSSDGGAIINPAFTVHSTGNTGASYNLSVTSSGATGCSVSPSQVTLAAGGSTSPAVSCTNGGPGNSGRVTLKAVYTGNSAILDTGWVTTSVNTYTVAVTPDNASTTLNAGTASSQTFTVQNNGNSSATYTLSAVCISGPTGCSSPAPLALGAGTSQNVTVNYTAGSAGTLGRVTLKANAGTGSSASTDSGWVTVSAVAPWTVAINPPALGESSPVSVTIYWCDRSFNFSDASRKIFFKGQDVTSQFTYTNQGLGSFGCQQFYGGSVYNAISTGTIYLTGGLTIDTLTASITDLNGTPLSATQAWQPANYQVAVTPHGGVATPPPNQVGLTQVFRIRNYGNLPATYTFSFDACTNGVSSCSVSPTSVFVSPGAANQQSVTVTYTSGAADTKGTIQLRATSGQFNDVGTLNVTNTASSQATTRVLATEINPGTSIDRESCLVFALVRDVASECGALRITHPLPSARTLNKVRTPTLVYYSDELDTTSLAVHLILADTATIPDSVWLQLWDVTSGSQVPLGVARKYSGSAWAGNRKQRLTVGQIAKGSTRIIKYQVEVKLKYGTQWGSSIYANGELAVVNRSLSRFGAGWWLAGVERLYTGQYDGSVLWVAGDGSTRKYVRSGTVGADTAYLTEAVRRPDTLFRSAQGVFRRSLPNGENVYFNAQGLDSATVNLLGHKTTFTWNSGSGEPQLTSIGLPSGSSALQYTFTYDASGQDSVVVAPGGRKVTLTRNAGGVGVSAIAGPDTTTITFEFQSSAPDRLYLARTDRRHTRTRFGFEPSSPATLANDSTMASSGKNVVDTLSTVIGAGASPSSGPIPVDGVYFRYVSPRRDSIEITKLWLDRFGAPTRIVNAIGDTTTIRRDDWRFPGQVTRVESPVLPDLRQHVSTATFDSHGNLKMAADLRPYYFPNGGGDSTDAVTRFEYDNVLWPSFVTRIVPPERDSIIITYNSDGTRSTQKDARTDSNTTIAFYYGNTYKLLSSAFQGGVRLDSLSYSTTMGNLAQDMTAAGYRTTFTQDGIGRDTLATVPVDGSQTIFERQRSVYDVMDRVDSAITIGDPFGRIAQQTLSVVNTYDAEGNLTSLDRWSTPDIPSNNIGHILTQWRYDNLNRKIQELAPDATYFVAEDNPYDEWRYDAAGDVDTVITRGVLPGKKDTLFMSYDRLHRLNRRTVPAVKYASRGDGIMHNPPAAYTQDLAQMDSTVKRTSAYPLFPNDPANNPGGYTVAADTSVFRYDKLGNITRADNCNAFVRRSFFLNGLPQYDTLIVGTLPSSPCAIDSTKHRYVIGHSYDLDGRAILLTHPAQLAPSVSQNTTRYLYDAAGNLRNVTDALGNSFNYGYDARGQLGKWTLASLPYFSEAYGYDVEGNLTSDIITDRVTPTQYRHSTFSYWPGGKLYVAANNQATLDTTWAEYSALGHLVDGALTEALYANGNNNIESRSFNVDALGNVYLQYTNTYYQQVGSSSSGSPDFIGESRMFGTGTGRLAAVDTYLQGQSWSDHRDTTWYDASGNANFETTVITNTSAPSAIHDRVSYYGSDGKLRAADSRTSSSEGSIFQSTFDEYRYDALGRRVLVYSRNYCWNYAGTGWPQVCNLDMVRRTVWDGGAELYEIQMPIDPTVADSDLTPLALGKMANTINSNVLDPNPFYGRVAYTHGLGVDRPQDIIRIGYVSKLDVNATETDTVYFAPFAILPLWDARGQQSMGVYPDRGFADTTQRCMTKAGYKHCVLLQWPGNYLAYDRPSLSPHFWHGTIQFSDKQDATGLFYRRNRYYDGKSGRFTQEDPMGISGGLNVYGFAAGDPVNFSDPFGLCKKYKDGSEDANCRRLVNELNATAREADKQLPAGTANHFREAAAAYEATDREVDIVGSHDKRLNYQGYNDDGKPDTFAMARTMDDRILICMCLGEGDRMAAATHEILVHGNEKGIYLGDIRPETGTLNREIYRQLPNSLLPTAELWRRLISK